MVAGDLMMQAINHLPIISPFDGPDLRQRPLSPPAAQPRHPFDPALGAYSPLLLSSPYTPVAAHLHASQL
jgi:hypothetical protein